MATDVKLIEWLKGMGYNATLPRKLDHIYNPSTRHIWDQIISNIKSRNEVRDVRHNIIVNRLDNHTLADQDDFGYPIKEIKIYELRERMMKKKKFLEQNLAEKSLVLDKLLLSNKITYVSIQHVKEKIIEHETKTYVLDEKCKVLDNDIWNAQETLSLAKNLTPVEMDDNSNTEEITKRLQKCAEKLQKLIEKKPPPVDITSKTGSKYTVCKSTGKKLRHHAVASNNSLNSFSLPSTTKNEKVVEKKSPKRESLGLLPDSLLDECDDDLFLESCYKADHSVSKTLFTDNNFTIENSAQNSTVEDIVKLSNNQSITENVRDLLYTQNRQLILKQCQEINRNLISELKNVIMNSNKVINNNESNNEDDFAKLHHIHIKNELQKLKCIAVLKKLRQSLARRKSVIISKSPMTDKAKGILDLQIEEAALEATIEFLRKEVSISRKIDENKLHLISMKLKQINEKLMYEINIIEGYLEVSQKVLECGVVNQEETGSLVRRLSHLIIDSSWANGLKKNLCSMEVKTFEKFPMNYNRILEHNGTSMNYRDICQTMVPVNINLDANSIEMVTSLIDIPYSPAENVVLNFMQLKLKADLLKEYESYSGNVPCKKYSLSDLSSKEQYVSKVIHDLKIVQNSSDVQRVLAAAVDMKEVVDLWNTLSLGHFISDKRQVAGHCFTFYENKFDRLSSL